MLSYQHVYHAGNLADVQKHALLAAMLYYMTRKDKPLSYIETHAGRGLYHLGTPEAMKTGEAAAGIGRLEVAFPSDHPYVRFLGEVRARYGSDCYPGSPLIAAGALRAVDTIHLFELHPREHAELEAVMLPFGAHVRKDDGIAAALSLCPPTPRRGLLLIDPSYEVKDDYTLLPGAVSAIRQKWNVGIIVLWYPILRASPHLQMIRSLKQAHPDALCHEVMFEAIRQDHRMIGSGMFIINPTYGLEQETARLDGIFKSFAQS